MKAKLVSTAAVALFAASTALAQTPGETETPATTHMGGTWTDNTINAFFQQDNGELTLLEEEDIRSNFDALPDEDQAQVRAECAALLEGEDAATIDAPERAPDAAVQTITAAEVSEETWQELCEIVGEIEDL